MFSNLQQKTELIANKKGVVSFSFLGIIERIYSRLSVDKILKIMREIFRF